MRDDPANQPFQLWATFDVVEKAEDAEETRRGRIKGIASASGIDADGEIILQKGLDWEHFLSKGFISLEHPLGVANIIGEPVGISLIKSGEHDATEITADLLLDDPMGRQVWEKARMLKKSGSGRRLGFSIEGRAIERDGSTIRKAKVMSVAISATPKNPLTYFEPVMASMLWRAFNNMSTGLPGGSTAPMIPESFAGTPAAGPLPETTPVPRSKNAVSAHEILVVKLLTKLPHLTWSQGVAAVNAVRAKL